MKLLNKEIEDRLKIKLDKSIKKDGVNGIYTFGENNDYPQIIEKLINSSVTAKAAINIYSKFLIGQGFTNQSINNVVIGMDARGKQITPLSLLRQTAIQCAYFNGFYWHLNISQAGIIADVYLVPFKDCRIAKPDDTGYSAKIAYYDNWLKEKPGVKYDKSLITEYHVFNLNQDALNSQFKDKLTNRGQVFFNFMDNDYFYPLSPFDSCYLDLDTESQIQLYRNRQIRNGFFDKIVMRVAPDLVENTNDERRNEREEFEKELKRQLGPDGDTIIVLTDDVDENGNIKESGAFKLDNIQSNVNDKLFTDWEKGIANNIRKSIKGMPALLIDYEENRLGNTSGEAITQAVNYFNSLTAPDRKFIEDSFKEIFSHHKNPILSGNTDWSILPLDLFPKEKAEQLDQATVKRIESQATLKGSVGGVQALIQLQQSVSQGLSDINSAVEIVKEIYGIPEDIARKMIGNPEQNVNITQPTTSN